VDDQRRAGVVALGDANVGDGEQEGVLVGRDEAAFVE